MKKLKVLPKFNTEVAERSFWDDHDSTDYINWENARTTYFADLKPSTKTISLRLPSSLLQQIKVNANKLDIPYQSYMKILLSRSVRKN